MGGQGGQSSVFSTHAQHKEELQRDGSQLLDFVCPCGCCDMMSKGRGEIKGVVTVFYLLIYLFFIKEDFAEAIQTFQKLKHSVGAPNPFCDVRLHPYKIKGNSGLTGSRFVVGMLRELDLASRLNVEQ